MWGVIVRETFSAAHFLKEYRGKCERVHGHNYVVEVQIEGESLNEIGLLMDFNEVKEILKEITGPLDHSLLNKLPVFQEVNPTAENIARHIFRELKARLPSHLRVVRVTVWENENTAGYYHE